MPDAPAKQPAWIRRAIAAGNAFHVRRERRARHNALNLSLLALLGLGFFAVACASRWLSPWAYLLLAAPAFAWLIFSLFVLVVHEASHEMFVVARNRTWTRRLNRFFGWVCAAPLGMDYGQHWERGHIIHHRQACEPADPQNCSVLVGRPLLREIALVALVPGYIQWRSRKGVGISYACPAVRDFVPNRVLSLFKILFWTAFVVLAARAGSWAVPVAMLLGLQLGSALQLVKVALEHGGDFATETNPFLRSRSSLFPFRRLVLPLNISLHFQHHLNAGVPWYALPRYGRALASIVPPELQPRFFSTEIWGQLRGRVE
jgi:fatty acid desaturase